jgi:hypothetical protein
MWWHWGEKYSGISKLFEYAMKSYLKNLAWFGMP